MDIHFIKNIPFFTFCFHPDKLNIFYLKENQETKSLIIVEEDLLTNGIMNTFVIPKDVRESSGYHLLYYRKKHYLVLAYPPCQLWIWDTQSSSSLLHTETRGKNPYFINALTFSEVQPVIFFAAVGQRNIYCANVNDAISNGFFVNYTKLKVPKKVHVFDLKTHPVDTKIVAACSDGYLRIWNYNGFTSLKHIAHPQSAQQGNNNNNSGNLNNNNDNLNQIFSNDKQSNSHSYQCVNFSNDGNKLLTGSDQGMIFIYDGRTLGKGNTLLAQTHLSEVGIFSLCWIFYNGDYRSDQFIAYTGEGSVKLLSLNMTLQQIREQQQQQKKSSSNSKKSGQKSAEPLGKIVEISKLQYVKNDLKISSIQSVNLGFSSFLQAHTYSNLIAFNTVHTKMSQAQTKPNFTYQGKLFLLHDKLYDKIEYPIISGQYAHNLQDLLPQPAGQIVIQTTGKQPSSKIIEYSQQSQNQRLIAFQSQLFYIENMEIKSFSLARGQIRSVLSLKQILFSENIKFYNIQFRPLTLSYTENGKFLLSYKLENNFVATIVKTKVEQNNASNVENFKEIPCAQAIFLGLQHFKNPPIYFLHENRTSYTIELDEEQPFDSETASFLSNTNPQMLKCSLSVCIQRVFTTPIRQGFVIIYQTMNENLLRFSKNRIESNPNYLDYGLLTSEYQFRSEFDETIIDVVWQDIDLSTTQKQLSSRHIGAVISLSKIYIISDTLAVFHVFKINSQASTNLVIQAKWFGPTLFYSTQTHIHYVTVMGSGNTVLSFDNYESKNLIGMAMMDRLLVVQKNNTRKKASQSQLEFKCKTFSVLEPLVLGYLDSCELFQIQPQKEIVKIILQTYVTHSFSANLISRLNSLGMFNFSQFLLKLDETKQFSPYQQMAAMKNLLEPDGFTQLLFPNKNPISDKGDAAEIMKKLQLDPRYSAQKKHLLDLQNYYLLIGQYQQAYQCASLLSDYKHILYLGASMNNPDFLNLVAKQVLNSDTGRFVHKTEFYLLNQLANQQQQQQSNEQQQQMQQDNSNNNNNIFVENFSKYNSSSNLNFNEIGNIQNLNLKQNKQIIKEMENSCPEGKILAEKIQKANNLEKLEKIKLNFGETTYKQIYFEKPLDEGEDDEGNQVNLQNIDFLANENLKSFLGLCTVFESKGQGAQGGQQEAGNGGGGGGAVGNDAANDFDFGEDNEGKEFQDIVIYWRFDDSKGTHIDDLSNYENHADIVFAQQGQLKDEDIWISLDDGEPMELEDNWGKKCPAQFAIEQKLPNTLSVTSLKKNWFRDKVKDFTIEIWFKPFDGNGCIFSIGNENLSIELNNYEPIVKIKGEKVEFQPYKDEESDDNPTNEEIDRKLKQNCWNHLCLLYEKEQTRLILIIGCKFQFAAEEKDLPITLFKDSKVVLMPIGSGIIGQVTEFRVRKLRYSYKEIKDEYKTPLSIVAEKRKKIKMKLKEKGDNQQQDKAQDLKKFKIGQQFGFSIGLPEQDLTASQQNQQQQQNVISNPVNENVSKNQNNNSNFNFRFSMPPQNQEEEKEQIQEEDNSKNQQVIKSEEINFEQKEQVNQTNIKVNKQENIQVQEEEKNQFQFNSQAQSNDNAFNSNTKGFETTSQDVFSNFKDSTNTFQSFTTDFRQVSMGFSENNNQFGFGEEQNQFQKKDQDNNTQQQFNKPEQQQQPSQNQQFGSWDDFKSFSTNSVSNNQQNNFEDKQKNQNLQQFDSNTFNDQVKDNVDENAKNKNQFSQDQFSQNNQFNDNFNFGTNTSNQNFANNAFDQESQFQDQQSYNKQLSTQSVNSFVQQNIELKSTFSTFSGFNIEKNKNDNNSIINNDVSNQNQLENKKSQKIDNETEIQQKNIQSKFQETTFSQPNSIEVQNTQQQLQQPQVTKLNSIVQQQIAKQDTIQQTINQPQQVENQDKELSSTQKIQICIDKASEELMKNNVQSSINEINQAFELIKQFLKTSTEEKAKQVQKVIGFCATYRFALQLLIGIAQMKQQDYKKKEIFLYLILIYLNLKPNHRVKFIIDAIERSIETNNTILADALVQSLVSQLEKVQVQQTEMQRLESCKIKLAKIPEKQNQNLNKMTCPYCQKVFHYKGVKKCNKCDKEFLLCYQTLNCLAKEQCLKCISCQSVFSPTIKKVNDLCPICRINNLVNYQ